MKAAPRVLLAFSLSYAWDRGILRGLLATAREHGWELLHTPPTDNVAQVCRTWEPAVLVTEQFPPWIEEGDMGGLPVIAANVDLTARDIPSVCCDDAAVARLTADHFASNGLRHMAAFTYSHDPFGVARAAAFRSRAQQLKATYHGGGEFSSDVTAPDYCSHASIISWLTRLPKPCGVFACCDSWARPVASYCRHLGLRIPEDIALVGADNDTLICELASPPLSSVAIPWKTMGATIADMINSYLKGKPLPTGRRDVQPIGVVVRRSSDLLSIDDPEVAEAVRWIRQNAHRVIGVSDVLRAIPVYRQKLERRFKAVLGRTIMHEVRQAHVAIARNLLVTTKLPMADVAERSGFSNATMLGIAFQRETGYTPSAYRRMYDHDAEEEFTGVTG